MLSMVRTHPHTTGHSGKGRIKTIHVKCQGTKITVNKLANKFTPTIHQTNIHQYHTTEAFHTLTCTITGYLRKREETRKGKEILGSLGNNGKKTKQYFHVQIKISTTL